jgi:hypothetical protein
MMRETFVGVILNLIILTILISWLIKLDKIIIF